MLDKRPDDGRVFKCTLCYDRLEVGQEPACAKACPTDSIQFGELETLRERAGHRVEQLHEAGVAEARLYGHDPGDGVGGDGAFFLLLDEPEVYGLPPDPVVTTRDLASMWRRVGIAAGGLLVAGVGARCCGGASVNGGRWTRPAAGSSEDSYYGRPIINPPVWEEREIAGYLFCGGLAGASSILAAAADASDRPHLADARPAVRERRRDGLVRGADQGPRAAGAVREHACGCSSRRRR